MVDRRLRAKDTCVVVTVSFSLLFFIQFLLYFQ